MAVNVCEQDTAQGTVTVGMKSSHLSFKDAQDKKWSEIQNQGVTLKTDFKMVCECYRKHLLLLLLCTSTTAIYHY